MKIFEWLSIYFLVFIIVGAMLAYLLPQDKCLDSGGCWDAVDQICRKKEILAQELCDWSKSRYSGSVQIFENHKYCKTDDECGIAITECSCDCGQGVNKKYVKQYAKQLDQYCFENPPNQKYKLICENKVFCVQGLCVVKK